LNLEPSRMRGSDLLGIAFSALNRHKVRTILTLLGVAIGTFALASSLAIGRGVDNAILGLFRGTDSLRQVGLYIRYETVAGDVPLAEKTPEGKMSAAKRERIEHALIRKWGNHNVTKPKARFNLESLDQLRGLKHVIRVVPNINQFGFATLSDDGKQQEAWFASADPDGIYRSRLVAGQALSDDNARDAIVHEYLLYQMGIVAEEDVEKAIGRTIRVEYRVNRGADFSLSRLLTFGSNGFSTQESEALIRFLQRLTPIVKLLPVPSAEQAAFIKLLQRTPIAKDEMAEKSYFERFTVVGVMRESSDKDQKQQNSFFGMNQHADILLPPQAVAAFFLKAPANTETGINNVILTVDDTDNVKAVSKAAEDLGYSTNSLSQVLETIRLNVMLITLATAFIAIVALAVAAIGITNTMIMSVLERTHEIGIMKALGARTGQIRTMFLVEGAVIGLLGGISGMMLAWLISFPGDRLAKSIMESQTPRPVEGSLFNFPLWLILGAPSLAALIAMIAAVYPAHRAARVDPITSLRHE
jgi:putative ABC transport system permease protein